MQRFILTVKRTLYHANAARVCSGRSPSALYGGQQEFYRWREKTRQTYSYCLMCPIAFTRESLWNLPRVFVYHPLHPLVVALDHHHLQQDPHSTSPRYLFNIFLEKQNFCCFTSMTMITPLLLLLLCVPYADGSCSTDTDCSLNGVCNKNTGELVANAEWLWLHYPYHHPQHSQSI